MKNVKRVLGYMVMGVLIWTCEASAASMNDYCVVPSFIQEAILPNLLLIIDNSASMYDLAYADKGRKVCSNATGTECTSNADCSDAGTCGFVSGSSRQPYYCYDQTFSTANIYAGYFDITKRYGYNFTDKAFEETTAAIDSTTCADGTNTSKLINGQLCVVYTNATYNAVTKFMASGNYLNWLTASKFDVQKKILTGGKFDGTRMLAESRGCVGQSFIKEANTANFVNYNSPPETNNTNSALGITFGIRGPYDTENPSAPSQGGQTYLDIYKGNYDQGKCQAAMTAIVSGTNNEIKNTVADCLASTVGSTAVTKTKVVFQQSMQACWQYRKSVPNTVGLDDINTVKNQCPDIYSTYATCSNHPKKVCTDATVATDCETGESCIYGPSAITPGNSALLCSDAYEGQYYELGETASGICKKNNNPDMGSCKSNSDCLTAGYKCSVTTGSGWVLKAGATNDLMIETHNQFCSDMTATPVTDPTDAPSDTSQYDNVPAILSGVGVEAQLSQPIGKLTVKLKKAPEPDGTIKAPTGVVSDFSKQVRMGAMTFNFAGSATESGDTVPVTKVCDNNTAKVCSINIDCGTGNCIQATNNLDGAKIIHYIGTGKCSTAGTVCYNKSDCPSGEACKSDGVGSWSSGLVKSINDIKASSWTPFSEAFYDAIGYFAKVPATGKSRTNLRINATDFNENRNPSQYPCQSNNILLISDGMSTADRNPNVDNLAKAYTSAGGATSWTTGVGGCPPYGGSVNVDNIAWIGRNRNIQTLSLTTDDGTEPAKKSERVTTYVVFNGDSNGLSGECDSKILLGQTAKNGGTKLYQAVDPAALDASLRDAFRDISGGAASGTAASILSNSEGSGANILQAVFYPKKDFKSDTSASWIGEMQNLWYFVDPYIGNSSVREDTEYTTGDHVMNLTTDYVTEFYFDSEANDTKARLKKDTDGNGSGDVLVTSADDSRVTATVPGVVPADDVSSIWRAGRLLWDRDLTQRPRVLYTYLYGATATGCSGSFSKTTLFDLVSFNWTDNENDSCILQKYLDAAGQDEAKKIIRYTHGYDTNTDGTPIVINGKDVRNRTVKRTTGGAAKVWKLGDIVASTPRVQSSGKLNNYHLDPSAGYGDKSYANDNAKTGFTNSTDYKSRGMVYAGANDGMLHAFNLGTLTVSSKGSTKATLSGTSLGEEQWSFIPKDVLPYLKYLADPAYSHLFLVDGNTKIVDASVGYNDASSPPYTCTADNYWSCERDGSTTANKSWRTILIGSMGIGGASRTTSDACTDKVAAGNCVKAPTADAGFSSYYALDITDITDPAPPQFLWDFSDPTMGYSTSGAAVARIGYKFESGGVTYKNTNGRWYAVIGNGPTGPIDTATHQFMGKSDKPLKIFVLDLKHGPKTGYKFEHASTLDHAFAGLLTDATIDTDRWNKNSDGFYSDDALYFGYSQCTANCDTAAPTWNGGVIRLLTNEKLNPSEWEITRLISNTGPVTTSIGRLQDRRNHKLWLYFGSGRYFFKEDDQSAIRKLIGVKDHCYKGNDAIIAPSGDTCRSAIDFSSGTGFVNQSTISASTGDNGWYITLDGEDTTNGYSAERSITDPVAMTNGAVFFTTFKPSVDVCNFGGNSYMWGVKYDTGGLAPSSALQGKALVQVSTGSFEEVNLATALTAMEGRKMGTPMVGKPPNDPPPIVSPSANKPLKRVIHIRAK